MHAAHASFWFVQKRKLAIVRNHQLALGVLKRRHSIVRSTRNRRTPTPWPSHLRSNRVSSAMDVCLVRTFSQPAPYVLQMAGKTQHHSATFETIAKNNAR